MDSDRNLGSSASRGAAFTMGGQLVRILLQLVTITILARLLSPTDYGLVAMVTAIVGIGEIFRDFGLSSAAIQAKQLTTAERNNLFWLNSLIGAVLTAIVMLASGPISAFYSEPLLQPLTVALSVTFLLNGISTQFRASLTRDLRLGLLTLSDIYGQFAGLALGISAALLGAGFWSLAIMQIGQSLVTLLASAIQARWLPGRYTFGVSMRHFLGFGTNLVAAQILTYASRNVDSVVIGARLGPDMLGIYNRAFQLLVLPLNQINAPSTRVALPTLSRLHDDPERYRRFILAGQTVLLHVVAAVFALAAAQATPLVDVVLGSKWSASVPVFQILALGGVLQAASYATYWVFLSKGLTRSQLLFSLATRPVLILLIIVGSQWGIMGVAAAYSLGTVIVWPVGLAWIRKSGAPALAMFGNGARLIVGYAIAGLASWGTVTLIGGVVTANPWLQILVGTAAFCLVLGLEFLLIRAFREDLKVMRRVLSLIRKRR